jgi:hypothetical protein
LVVGFAFAASLIGPDVRLSPVLVAAPVVAAGLVAFAYGPAADAAYEIVAATPLSPLTALLLRLAAVLAWSSVVVGMADFATGSERGVLAWFLPMTFVALLAATIGLRTQPVVGAASGMGVWMVMVIAATSVADDPAQWLWGVPAQVVYAAAVVLLLSLMTRWVIRGRGFVAPVSVHGADGGMYAS